MRHSPPTGFIQDASEDDPYKYQLGFGNHHVTEAIAGALPPNGTNLPKKTRYGLFAEHLNGTSFISSRETVSNVWMYRKRPAAAHKPVGPVQTSHQIEACFLPTNSNVSFTPLGYTCGPLSTNTPEKTTPTPSESGRTSNITFIQGLKTIGGHGDSTLKEGLAVHQYAFNTDMHRQALVNHDGDFLMVPQRGMLDIKTELGILRVKPGMIIVVPAGIRFSVSIVHDSILPAAEIEPGAVGYVLEIFGTHYTLPDLGVLGANGLAHIRDFEYPVATFDTNGSSQANDMEWEITIKLAGKLSSYNQPHTPFDVVAWHGRYAPFRYDMARFGHLTANVDQLDPTAYCVLTAPSKWPGVSLVDFCVFGEKWAVAQNTVRIPYYHRTMATELGGVIKGEYKGSVRPLEAGGLCFEQGYMPHGESYEAYVRDSKTEHEPLKVGKDYLGFMFHVSSHIALTKWAMEEHPDIRPERAGLWDPFQSHLLDHIDVINESLANAGLAGLDTPRSDQNKPLTPPATPNCVMVPDSDRRGRVPTVDVQMDGTEP
ncbi:Homogentisate 1,2-dioxygenase [Apodospora peruviana]|uniref:homogentisate 1,2-dioxygenase n=1 Tax=Apodospora peruviana TaxID=516989 RepID=A0AAE0MG00_9PEZI|nr:Homogentisate 1,2-dioxygenase [Apodospora peruviana]